MDVPEPAAAAAAGSSSGAASPPIIFPIDKLQSALYPEETSVAQPAVLSADAEQQPQGSGLQESQSGAVPSLGSQQDQSKDVNASGSQITPQTADALRDAYQQAEAVDQDLTEEGNGSGSKEVEGAAASDSTAEALR